MCNELLESIIQRLGTELKEWHGKVAQGRVLAATVETLVRRQL